MTAPRRSERLLPTIVATAAGVAALAAVAALLIAPDASGDRDRRIDGRKHAAKLAVATRLARSIDRAPLARHGRCASTANVAGVGQACRDASGLLVLPTEGATQLTTHGPDLVDVTPSQADADGGFGTADSILCSAPSASRHVVLAYLLPADFATADASGVHGDRSAEVVPQLRQALLDAATTIDRRAGELAPGTRRRLRVACDADGQPLVERIVLPRTAAAYRDSTDGGFVGIERDLGGLGVLPDYDEFSERHLPAVRRVLAYYDGDFQSGVAGQGVMFRRSRLLQQPGTKTSDPLVSRTVRNINNNPPSATFAVQYGTSYDGVPDPPLYTSLLHELAHTMGAVQDEPPTASDAGHCLDGLDVMCYDDGGSAGSYTSGVCADPTPATSDAADELFDCNGDTYFHPAPPAGNPLAAPTTWHLGLTANETLTNISSPAVPSAVTGLRATGRGTQIVLRWTPVAGARGYDVAYRPAGGTWQSIGVRATTTPPLAMPRLRTRTDYEFIVAAHDSRALTGKGAAIAKRTGIDTTPPLAPGRPVLVASTRTSVKVRFDAATDNEAVTKYQVEQRIGTRWVSLVTLTAPSDADAPTVTSTPIIRLKPGTTYTIRLRAIDARGLRSAPSPLATVATRR